MQSRNGRARILSEQKDQHKSFPAAVFLSKLSSNVPEQRKSKKHRDPIFLKIAKRCYATLKIKGPYWSRKITSLFKVIGLAKFGVAQLLYSEILNKIEAVAVI